MCLLCRSASAPNPTCLSLTDMSKGEGQPWNCLSSNCLLSSQGFRDTCFISSKLPRQGPGYREKGRWWPDTAGALTNLLVRRHPPHPTMGSPYPARTMRHPPMAFSNQRQDGITQRWVGLLHFEGLTVGWDIPIFPRAQSLV